MGRRQTLIHRFSLLRRVEHTGTGCRWSCSFRCPSGSMVDFRELSKDSFFHSLVSRVEKIEVQQSYTLLEQKQAYLKSNNEEEPRDLDWLRRANCWRLWQERGLSVKEISFALHMQPDTIINNILSFERKMENVDWFRLCDLVKLTSGVAESILVGRAKAKRKLSSSSGAVVFSASDIKKFCPQNVTLPHISLVHAMLGRGLLSSKIVQITSCTFENECEEITVNELHQAQYIGTASKSTTHVATNGQLSEPSECDGREETAGFANPVSDFRPYEAQEHTHDDAVRKEENSSASRTVNAVANGQLAVPHVCHGGWQETAAFANRDFDLEYNKHYECIHHQGLVFYKKYKSTFQDTAGQRMEVSKEFLPSPTVGTSKNVVTMSDILQWLQKNDGATLSNIVHTFEDCDAKHLLRLLLELMENSLLIQCHGKLRVAPEKCSSRLEMPRMMLLPTVLRMQRAKCLNGFVLSIIIHEPKRNVEFTIRSMKPCGCSIDYRVHIFKYPSCTCPDFCSRVAGGLDYIPCKHLFYVYMRQLVLGMDMEHVMHQEILTEADLERILEAYY